MLRNVDVTFRVLVVALLIEFPGTVKAFEVGTHAAITNATFQRVLRDQPNLLARLGFMSAPQSLSKTYFDVSGSQIRSRTIMPFERDLVELGNEKGLGLEGQTTLVNGWLMVGAVREDDNPSEGNPKDDPYQSGGAFHREFNHFFDPLFNRPLTISGLPWAYGQPIRKAVDWALGTVDAYTGSGTRDTESTWNHFTLFDAREAMFRALTLRQKNDSGYYDVPGMQTAGDAQATRLAYWATTFRALGDVLHLNQDMAQPQHTRNEPHSGKVVLEYVGAGHTSVFEKYMDERARRVTYTRPGSEGVKAPALPFDGYPTVHFEHFSDFWSTAPGMSSSPGAGLADYSNHGFFTPAANWGNSNYPYPSADPYPTESAEGLVPAHPRSKTTFLRGDVSDRYTGSSSNIRLTTESIWDRTALFSGERVKTYTLNRFNYDDMASLLIPRAVAYSAGIIEHFFRGEMAITLPDAGFYGIVDHARFVPSRSGAPTDPTTGFQGFDRIRVKVRNVTPRILKRDGTYVDQPMPAGALVAVLKFHRNTCYDDLLLRWPLTGSEAVSCRSPIEEIVSSDTIVDVSVPFATPDYPDGPEYTFHFPARELPINAWDVVLQVVYRGQLGLERDNVVVATKDIAEPTFVTFMNVTDYVVVNGRFYKPAELAARQDLFASVMPACRAGVPGSYTVSSGCYNLTDAFTFTTGRLPVTIAGTGDTAVQPRRLARIAMLTDPQAPPHLPWQINAVSCWKFLDNPLPLTPYTAEQVPDQGWTYGVPTVARALRGWETTLCYVDIGTQPTSPGDLDLAQLDNLIGQEIEPTPLTISGWY